MPAISKFLFEQSFDGSGNVAPPPKPMRRNYTAAEMEAEKAKAFAAGHAAGAEETTADIQARATASFEGIAAQVKQMAGKLDAHRDEALRAAVGVAAALTRKLLPALSRREAMQEIEALVADSLGKLHDEPKIVVRLNETHLETFRTRMDQLAAAAGFSGRLVAVGDPTLGLEDVSVEWGDGGVERNPQATWQEIEAIIGRYVAAEQPAR